MPDHIEQILRRIELKIDLMATTIDQLAADFATFQTAFATFVTNVQTALANIAAGGVTPAQQTELNNIDAGLTAMETTISGITFPAPPAARK